MNYSDRLEILTNVNADPLDVGTSKVVFFYTNGKKFTATNVVQMCFTEISTIEYTTVVKKTTPVRAVYTAEYELDTKDVAKVEVHTANGTIITTYRVR